MCRNGIGNIKTTASANSNRIIVSPGQKYLQIRLKITIKRKEFVPTSSSRTAPPAYDGGDLFEPVSKANATAAKPKRVWANSDEEVSEEHHRVATWPATPPTLDEGDDTSTAEVEQKPTDGNKVQSGTDAHRKDPSRSPWPDQSQMNTELGYDEQDLCTP